MTFSLVLDCRSRPWWRAFSNAALAPPPNFDFAQLSRCSLFFLLAIWGCDAGTDSIAPLDTIKIALSRESQPAVTVDLGEMTAVRRLEKQVRLENRTGQVVKLARIDAGCDCVSFQVDQLELEKDQEVVATLVVDLQDDPEFGGQLAVPVSGFDGSGRPVFQAVVSTRVSGHSRPDK